MHPLLPYAVVSMISALALYTVGVWSEKFQGRLKRWHLAFFWVGLICDTTGTTMMGEIAGGFQFNMHGLTGALGIFLMIVHAIWATVVLWLARDRAILNFHKFSLAVWAAWLVPFASGLILAS